MAKIIFVGNQTPKHGEELQAIVRLSEAKAIFQKLGNTGSSGVCLSNLGSLYMQMEEYQRAAEAFEAAAGIIRNEPALQDSRPDPESDLENTARASRTKQMASFVLAWRLFQRGRAQFAILKDQVSSGG